MADSHPETEITPPALTIALADGPEMVPIAELDPSRFLTARTKGTDPRIVAEYAEKIRAGETFPPIELFRGEGGELWGGDGAHRVEAARLTGAATIAAVVLDGGREAALKCAAAANESHGLRRSPADKRQAVVMLLADEELTPVLA